MNRFRRKVRLVGWGVAAAAVAVCTALGPSSAAGQSERSLARKSFLFSRAAQQDNRGFYFQPAGLCEDYPEGTTTSEKIADDFRILRETGTRLLRIGIGWDGIEGAPGEYDWRFWDEIIDTAEYEGVTLLPYVCYTPKWLGGAGEDFWRQPPRDLQAFARFMFAIASRYRGRVRSWELWNEPDNRDYWRGSAKQFATMFKAGAAAVRRADADATIVLGGLSAPPDAPFVSSLLTRHGLASWFDVLNFHGYFETWDNAPAEQYRARIREYQRAVRAHATRHPKPDLWLAEFGYSSLKPTGRRVSAWADAAYEHEHTAEFQAVALLRHHILGLASQQLSLTAWFRLRDLPAGEGVIGDAHNRHFGLVDVEGVPKPAFAAMRLWNRLCDQPVRTIPLEWSKRGESPAELHAFEKRDGNIVIAGWLGRGESPATSRKGELRVDSRREIHNVYLPGSRAGTLREYAPSGEMVRSGATYVAGRIEGLELTGSGILLIEVLPQPAPAVQRSPAQRSAR